MGEAKDLGVRRTRSFAALRMTNGRSRGMTSECSEGVAVESLTACSMVCVANSAAYDELSTLARKHKLA